MFDFEIAFYLYKMAKIHSVFLDSKYKAQAYYSAAMAIDSHNVYVAKMYREHKLQDIPYVGKKIEKCIIEIIETGRLQELKDYEEEFQIKDYTLLLSSGLSDNLIKKLWYMSVHSAEDLIQSQHSKGYGNALQKGEIAKIDSFKKEYIRLKGRYLQAYGDCLGKELIEFMRGIRGMQSVRFCGEMASECEKIQKIEIAFWYNGNWDYLARKIRGEARVVDVRGSRFTEISGKTEFGIPFSLVYKGQCIEVNDEVEKDDTIIDVKDLHGDLHTHTNWSDGIHSIEQMCQEAMQRRYEYIAITDHSVSMRVAHGLSENQALSQIREIRELEKKLNIRILAGMEVDILQDGGLDYSDEILCQFDFVIAAIHSYMNQSAFEMEERLRKALSNPYVNILAHPTGRLLGRPGVYFSDRTAYDISVLKIIELCKEYQVVLEVNCFPERLDLDAKSALLATNGGVKISLGTDAHSIAHLRNIEYGVGILKEAKIDANMVLNTYSYEQLMNFFQKQRPRLITECKTVTEKNKKDFHYYFKNNPDILSGKRKIIGIDLTGSEDKESGWAYMTGDYVECRRIKTDAELISTVINLKPDIVSVDSPLAYPKGRCCSQKDCECSKYGIMRKSERMLRHFGITVYPCLIDSMIKLTTRGMKLAKTLREMGYTVIESYPGVAQDVLQIPRKGKTQEQFIHLKQGLASFGINGDLLTNIDISHDEVDAITSALVGYFYLNNQYIGLGNVDEDYLIVPRIKEELLQKRIVIGLSGETGAGKTTVAEYLRFKYGLKYFRYSQIIAEKYQTQDKRDLQKIGAIIAQDEEEQRNLTRDMIKKMDSTSGYVIDGLRHAEDYDELKKYFGIDFIFIYIDCKYKVRCTRYQKLNYAQVTAEEFRNINNHISESEIAFLQMRADYCVDNNGSYKSLWNQIDNIVQEESGGNM